MKNVTAHVIATTEGTACEIEYRDDSGAVVGYWAYGAYDPELPYQGSEDPHTEDDNSSNWIQHRKN